MERFSAIVVGLSSILEVGSHVRTAVVMATRIVTAEPALLSDSVERVDVVELIDGHICHVVEAHLTEEGRPWNGTHDPTLSIIDLDVADASELDDGDSLIPADALATAAVVGEPDLGGAASQLAELDQGATTGVTQHGCDSVGLVNLQLPSASG